MLKRMLAVLALCAVALPASAASITLRGRTADTPPPGSWTVYDTNGKKVARATNEWGTATVEPGRYRLAVRAKGVCCDDLDWGEVTVPPDGLTVTLDSGLELFADGKQTWYPHRWTVVHPETGTRIGRAEYPTRFMPLPAGDYRLEIDADALSPAPMPFTVAAGKVTRLGDDERTFGLVDIPLPETARSILAGRNNLYAELHQGRSKFSFRVRAAVNATTVTAAVRPGKTEVQWRRKPVRVSFPEAVDVAGGQRHTLAFEPARMKPGPETGAFRVGADTAGKASWLTLADTERGLLHGLAPGPLDDLTVFAPAGAIARVTVGQKEHRATVPAGGPLELGFAGDAADPSAEAPADELTVTIASPPEGTLVSTSSVDLAGTVTGDSAGTADAATRIVFVVDVSSSAGASCGRDLDQDGQQDSIVQAEVAAGELLLDELGKLQEAAPASAFSIGLVAFGADAREITPLTSLRNTDARDRLRQGLREVVGADMGGTNYDRALETAIATLGAPNEQGTDSVVFLTDGKPSTTFLALDGAAKSGFARVTLYLIGLGDDFAEAPTGDTRFPPSPQGGQSILNAMAATGKPGGLALAAPVPADVLTIIPDLPIFEPPTPRAPSLTVVNRTTDTPATSTGIQLDGQYQATVPVSLSPLGAHLENELVVTATSPDGSATGTASVRVRGRPRAPGRLKVEPADAASERPPLQVALILDASGSMREHKRTVDGKLKIDVAKDVLTQTIERVLPDDAQVGIRVYGHRIREGRKGDCEDSELIHPFGPLDRAALVEKIQTIDALGTTPIAYSLEQVASDFGTTPGEKLVLLVTDGKEECGGDVAAAAEGLLGHGLEMKVNVVGFALADTKVKDDMRHVAELTGGQFFDAADGEGLLRALERGLAEPVAVLDGEGATVATGIVGDEIEVLEGTYTVRVGSGDGARTHGDVVITKDQLTTVPIGK